MQSVCIGRYVMELPVRWKRQQAGVDSGGDATFYFGHDENFTKIDASVEDGVAEKDFESAVNARESLLREKENFSIDASMFLSREEIGPKVALLSSYASVDSTDAIRLEVHAMVGQSHVVLGETAYSPAARPGVQTRLISMLSTAHGLDDRASEEGGGFCVGGVVFEPESDYEESGIAYAGTFAGVPVKLQVDINSFDQPSNEPGLIERGERNLDGLGVRPKKLRAGPRQLAGLGGEEWLGAFDENGQRLHGFYAETSARKPARESPSLMLSLLTGDEEGGPEAKSIDDDSAIALWDQVLASIRKRSG